MDARTRYFRLNRVWWSAALFVGPVAGVIAGEPLVAVVVTVLLLLPTAVVFDTARPWWPQAVRQLPEDTDRTRVERRQLAFWSGVALIAGVVIAIARPWG